MLTTTSESIRESTRPSIRTTSGPTVPRNPTPPRPVCCLATSRPASGAAVGIGRYAWQPPVTQTRAARAIGFMASLGIRSGTPQDPGGSSDPVVAARCSELAADAAEVVEALEPHVHLLVRHRELKRGSDRQVAPSTACEVPHAIAGERRLVPVLPLQRFHRVAALRGRKVCRRIRHLRRAPSNASVASPPIAAATFVAGSGTSGTHAAPPGTGSVATSDVIAGSPRRVRETLIRSIAGATWLVRR